MRIVVVGAGLAGVASALSLTRRGFGVTVIDRAAAAGRGASFANGGLLTPSMPDPWNAPGVAADMIRWFGREDSPLLLRWGALPGLIGWGLSFLKHARPGPFAEAMRANLTLARYSLTQFDRLAAQEPALPQPAATGSIKVYRSDAAFAEARRRVALLQDHGLDATMLPRDALVAAEPALARGASELVGGLRFDGDRAGDALHWITATVDRLASQGVDFRWGLAVRRVRRDGDGAIVEVEDGEPLRADRVVLAAGAWTSQLAGNRLRAPIRPVKGYSITIGLDGVSPRPRFAIIDDAMHAAATPLDGGLRVAGTAELAGYDTCLKPARIALLKRAAARLYPSLAEALEGDVVPWTGLRPVTPDGRPLIGAIDAATFVNAGHGHLGWTLATGSAELLADLITGTTPAIDAAPYRAAR